MTLKHIEAKLGLYGYEIRALDSIYGDGIKILHKSTLADFNKSENEDYYGNEHDDDYADNHIKFDTETLNFCCGVQELGELDLGSIPTKKKSKNNLYEATKLMALYALILKKDELKSKGKAKTPTARQLMFTSNGKNGWEIVEEALADEIHFKLVATTRNPGSKSILKTYIGVY